MIEMIWHDSNPPMNERVFRVKNINNLIMATDFGYDADGIVLTNYEHKNVLIRCHNKHEDHLFSVEEYHAEIMIEFSEKIIQNLLNKRVIMIAKTHDNQYYMATHLGFAVVAGLAQVDLTDDEFNFMKYLVSESQPLNLLQKYNEEDIEFIEGDEDA